MLILLNNGPKCNISGAGHLNMPKRSHKELSLSEKVKVLDEDERKKSYAEVVEIYGKNKFSSCEIVQGK